MKSDAHLLVNGHGSHWIARVWIVSKNIKNATTVDKESVSPKNKNFCRVESPTCEASSVDIAECGGELDDVVPDHGLRQEPRGVQGIGLLPKQIVLCLGVGPGSVSVERIHQWSG